MRALDTGSTSGYFGFACVKLFTVFYFVSDNACTYNKLVQGEINIIFEV